MVHIGTHFKGENKLFINLTVILLTDKCDLKYIEMLYMKVHLIIMMKIILSASHHTLVSSFQCGYVSQQSDICIQQMNCTLFFCNTPSGWWEFLFWLSSGSFVLDFLHLHRWRTEMRRVREENFFINIYLHSKWKNLSPRTLELFSKCKKSIAWKCLLSSVVVNLINDAKRIYYLWLGGA